MLIPVIEYRLETGNGKLFQLLQTKLKILNINLTC